jgi:hypothetical protein
MRCPDCKSTVKLKKTSNSQKDTVCHREYYCRCCGVSLRTDETMTAMKRPKEGTAHGPARSQSKYVRDPHAHYRIENDPLPEGLSIPAYKGQ